jgi:hypothetical protein
MSVTMFVTVIFVSTISFTAIRGEHTAVREGDVAVCCDRHASCFASANGRWSKSKVPIRSYWYTTEHNREEGEEHESDEET